MEGPVPEQCRLFEFNQGDVSFLRKVGIRPCVIRYRRPRPLLPSFPAIAPARLTGKDIGWLRECGVAWEQRPAVQLSLDFCGRQEAVQETQVLSEARMKKECSSCNGTGKCPQCKGTGRLGYPGYGEVSTYRTPCLACQESGVCRVCRGTGQK
jgi:hypothetical protein